MEKKTTKQVKPESFMQKLGFVNTKEVEYSISASMDIRGAYYEIIRFNKAHGVQSRMRVSSDLLTALERGGDLAERIRMNINEDMDRAERELVWSITRG